MGRKIGPKCKQCRREGEKLFLRGERCFLSKCAMIRRNYPPGIHGVKGKPRLTDYGKQMREKQKAKRIYGILERQFRNYFFKADKKKGETGENILRFLEMRLDNIVFRLGFAKSRKQARQLVNHGHFRVNNKRADIPSYQVKPKDIVTIGKSSLENQIFKNLKQDSQKHEIPLWLTLDVEKLEGRVLNYPSKGDLKVPFDVKLIVEYYSK